MKTENAMAAMGLRCSDCVYFERDGNGDSGVCLTDVAFINVNAGDGVCGAFTQIGCANASEMSVVKRLRAQYMSKANGQAVQTIKKGHTAMKIFMTVVLSLWANLSFALTETIDGVTWTYQSGTLGQPGFRSKGECPAPAHEGTLPPVLKLPRVGAIDVASVQIPDESAVQRIIVPETVTRMPYECAILGQYKSTDTEFGSTYDYIVFRYSSVNCDVVFLGDCPYNSSSSGDTWDIVNGRYTSRYACRAGSKVGGASIFVGRPIFENATCYVVEGTTGWPTNGKFCGGTMRYLAAKVNFEPKDGVIGQEQKIELSCTNATAKIYYTTDGSNPLPYASGSTRLYSEPISVGQKVMVKVLAYVKEYPEQITYEKEFALGKVNRPTAVSSEGTPFNWSGNSVTLFTETDGAEIRYTLDGSEPTENSKLYTGPFTIDDTTTIKAKAFKTDWFDSATATATFTREWYTVETPMIEPTEAEFANVSQEVSIACATDGAAIYYTTDGSDPAENGLEYKHPFTIYKSCTVRAVAKKYDWKNSAETTATFTRAESLSEATNCFGYKMETGADASWVVDDAVSHDGISSVRSGGDGSYLQMSVRGAGTLSFWWRAQCEEPGYEYYDYGCVKMGSDRIGRIAGEDTGWEFFSTKVASTAKHVFRWEYHKDEEGSYLPDCIWVDQVQWIPADGSGYTLTTPEPVPYAWLDQYNLGVGTDYETAGNAVSGKMNWGKPSAVWEEYVAGLDPTDTNSRLVANIEMRDGAPFVSWTPDLNTNGIIRTYKVYGSETLENGGNWQYPTNSLHRFFRVKVEMP